MASAPVTHRLPEDLMVDILARLPVKSLKRFNCVRKSWYSLIQSPQFISTHYSFSQREIKPLIKHDNYTEIKTMVSLISNQTFDIVESYEIPCFTTLAYSRGCCNGIICLCDQMDGCLLWNIATKEFKILPICPVEYPPDCIGSTVVVGLGYDSKGDDYKVIRIDTFVNEGYFSEGEQIYLGHQVALYNLSTDSWKMLNPNLTVEFYYLPRNQVYCNGFYHVLAVIDEEKLLLSFGMSSEAFVATPFPDDFFGEHWHRTVSLFFEINGSFGAIICPDNLASDKCFKVWVLGEVSVKNSWMKLFTIDVEPTFHAWPVGVIGNEVLFDSYFEDSTVLPLLNSSNQVTKMLQFQGIVYYAVLLMYAESLVSLRGGTAFNH